MSEARGHPEKPKCRERKERDWHVLVDSDASEREIQMDDVSGGSIRSLNPRELYDRDTYTPEVMRQMGWCNNDGTPWIERLPQDEAALLKRGIINRKCRRGSYRSAECVSLPDKKFYDEVEMFKNNLVDRKGRPTPLNLQQRVVNEQNCEASPITYDELVRRGYVDKRGTHHRESPAHLLECFYEEIRNYHTTRNCCGNDQQHVSFVSVGSPAVKDSGRRWAEQSARLSKTPSPKSAKKGDLPGEQKFRVCPRHKNNMDLTTEEEPSIQATKETDVEIPPVDKDFARKDGHRGVVCCSKAKSTCAYDLNSDFGTLKIELGSRMTGLAAIRNHNDD